MSRPTYPKGGLGNRLLGGLGRLSALPRLGWPMSLLVTHLVGALGRLLGMPVGRHLGRFVGGVGAQLVGGLGRRLGVRVGRHLERAEGGCAPGTRR